MKRGPPEGPDDNRDAAQAKHHKASSDVCSPDTGTSDVCSPDTITSHACPPDMGTPDACPPAAPPPSARPVQRLRDLYEEIVPVRYSGYKPRNDFELLALGGGDYSFVEDGGLEAFLEKEWSSFVAELNGNPDTLMDEVRRTLDEPAEVVGVSFVYFLSHFIPSLGLPDEAAPRPSGRRDHSHPQQPILVAYVARPGL